MKKMRQVLRKNHGAALVAVLIGVLFITILASSLLYMSTLNYQMKGTRYGSTVNFYSAEYAVEDMLSHIRQKVELHPDKDNSYEELKYLLEVPTKDSAGHTYFNEKNLRDMIHISGLDSNNAQIKDANGDAILPSVEGIESIEVSSIYKTASGVSPQYTKNTYEDNGSSIFLYGVKVTVKTDEAHGNYESTISLDIEFAFPTNTSKTRYSLGQFSILSDTPLSVEDGNHLFTGSLYCRKNGNTTIGANNAFKVGSNAVVTILSPFAFFDGNMEVSGGGALFVSGNVYVHGNLNISNQASVFITGSLYVSGSLTGGDRVRRTGQLYVGGKNVDDADEEDGVDWTFYDKPTECPECGSTDLELDEKGMYHCKGILDDGTPCSFSRYNYADGLANLLMAPKTHFFINDLATDEKPSGYDSPYRDFAITSDQLCELLPTKIESSGTFEKYVSGVKKTLPVNAIITKEDPIPESKDTLVLGYGALRVQNPLENSTYINIAKDSSALIRINGLQAHPNTWGHMDDETYDAATHLYLTGSWSANVGGTINQPGFPGSGQYYKPEPDTSTTDTSAYTINGNKVFRFAGADGAQPYYRSASTVSGKYVNYIMYGNLLSDDIGTIMNGFTGGGTSGGGPSVPGSGDKSQIPSILIAHWTKD